MTPDNWIQYREYFLGGPFNGQDRLSKPEAGLAYTGIIRYFIPGDHFPGDFESCPLCRDGSHKPDQEGLYYLRRVQVGATLLNAWIHFDETDPSAQEKLWEIILAPHKAGSSRT